MPVSGKTLTMFGLLMFVVSVAVLVGVAALLGQEGTPMTTTLLQSAALGAVAAFIFKLLSRQAKPLKGPIAQSHTEEDDPAIEVDVLTRQLNQHGLTIKLLELMALAERYGNELSVAVIMVDHIDDVKDKYGPQVGDNALQAICAELYETLRMPDRLGRWDANQFVVVLPETSLQGARNIGERLRGAVAGAEFEAQRGVVLTLTASIGVTSFRLGDDLESLMSRVGRAVDAARNQGSNRVSTHLAA